MIHCIWCLIIAKPFAGKPDERGVGYEPILYTRITFKYSNEASRFILDELEVDRRWKWLGFEKLVVK